MRKVPPGKGEGRDVTRAGAEADASTGGNAEALQASHAPQPASAGRYVLGAEIARGGMGAVYRATDTVFGREVAVKVLLDKYAPTSGTARRFLDEARITGQLQHPGIPPVHDLGTLPDGRPFLAMKLIKGDTLDDLLAAGPSRDRGRFVAVFEQVCQAVAYAHAHDVIHRDLKPANVMVGTLRRGAGDGLGTGQGPDRPAVGAGRGPGRDRRRDRGEVACATATDRSRRPAACSARRRTCRRSRRSGRSRRSTARSDVFGLGGILAAILTGRPPFVGETAETTRLLAAQGKVGECFARLDACGADPELVALCKRCLAPEKDDRPADAGEVAEAVAALRQAADERARQAELDRARAEAQAIEQRKRRRMVQWTGGIVAGTLLAGIIGTTIGFQRATEQKKTAEKQRDEIAEREREVARLKKIAEDRLHVYQKAVDRFVNEAPAIIDGHPLGPTPARDLLELCGKLLEEVHGTGVDDAGLAVRGQMSAIIRKGHMAKTEGRLEDAEKYYNDAFKTGPGTAPHDHSRGEGKEHREPRPDPEPAGDRAPHSRRDSGRIHQQGEGPRDVRRGGEVAQRGDRPVPPGGEGADHAGYPCRGGGGVARGGVL